MATTVGQWLIDFNRSVRENIRDVIFEQTPTDTPVFDMTGNIPTKSIFHGWLEEDLAVRQDNAQAENATFDFNEVKEVQTRRFNWAQIFKREIRISRSNMRTSHYAIDDLLAYNIQKKGKRLKTDIEHALVRGTMTTAFTSSTRRMQGILMAFCGNSNYTLASNMTLTEARLNDFFERQAAIQTGMYDVLVGATLKRRISGFTANQGGPGGGVAGLMQFRDQNDLTIVNTVSAYLSDFGPSNIHWSKDVPKSGEDQVRTTQAGDMILVDRSSLKKAWIDDVFVERTAKVADGFDAVIIAELTLEWGHFNGAGVVRFTA